MEDFSKHPIKVVITLDRTGHLPSRPTAAYRGVKLAAGHALNELHRARPLDPLEAQFRLNSVWTGAWTTLIICVPALVYSLTGGGTTNRALFVSSWAMALVAAALMFILPWGSIIASRWRELAFLGWSVIDLTLIVVAAVSDGGAQSPVTWLFFLPVVFAGGSYPTWSVKLIGGIGLAMYTGLALAYGQPLGRSVLVLGGLGGAALVSWWQAQNAELRRRHLDLASVTDPLTGCLNRRGLDAVAAAELARVERFGTPVALIIIDLDDFKGYNDSHGHVAGDRLLAWVVAQITATLRPTDALARLGGDEFVVLVAGADSTAAEPLAARIHDACVASAPHCTGIASAPDDGVDFDALYRAADHRLYEAKHSRPSVSAVPTARGG
jgi:diguanylate cyclase (GGDEF)-like protein